MVLSEEVITVTEEQPRESKEHLSESIRFLHVDFH